MLAHPFVHAHAGVIEAPEKDVGRLRVQLRDAGFICDLCSQPGEAREARGCVARCPGTHEEDERAAPGRPYQLLGDVHAANPHVRSSVVSQDGSAIDPAPRIEQMVGVRGVAPSRPT